MAKTTENFYKMRDYANKLGLLIGMEGLNDEQ